MSDLSKLSNSQLIALEDRINEAILGAEDESRRLFRNFLFQVKEEVTMRARSQNVVQ